MAGGRPVRLAAVFESAVFKAAAIAGVVCVAAWLLAAVPALAQDPSVADIQWAQIILKDKGFNIGGRATGKMTPETRNALSAYQRSVGLPVTGQLDKATVDRMLAERQSVAPAGNLAAQKPGAGSGAAANAAERDSRPRAAPTQRVEGAGSDAAVLNPLVRAPVPADGGPEPTAVPASPVAVSGADGGIARGPGLSSPSGTAVPGWVRYAVMAVVAGTLGGIVVVWWRSGRRPSGPPRQRPAVEDDTRREPSFAARGERTAGPLPPLSAPRRERL